MPVITPQPVSSSDWLKGIVNVLIGRSSASCPWTIFKEITRSRMVIVQELCESRGGRPGLSVLTSLLVSVDVKIY